MIDLAITNVCKKHIEVRIAELKTTLANVTHDMTADASNASEKANAMIKDASSKGVEFTVDEIIEFERLTSIIHIKNKQAELERLQTSLSQDLVKVNATFMATTDNALSSPAGFSVGDRVFVQPKVAFYSNQPIKASELPHVSSALYLHNIDAICLRN